MSASAFAIKAFLYVAFLAMGGTIIVLFCIFHPSILWFAIQEFWHITFVGDPGHPAIIEVPIIILEGILGLLK